MTGVVAAATARRSAVLITLVGAGAALLAGTRTWATVTVSGALPGLSELTVPGRHAAAGVIPIALAAAAGAIVLATSGRMVRAVVAAGLLIAGVAVVVSGVHGALDRSAITAIAVRDSLGVYSSRALEGSAAAFGTDHAQVSVTIWAWVAVFGGVLLGLAGLLTLIGGRAWSGPTRRYDREATAGPRAQRSVPVKAAASGGGGDGPAGTWDALSRGEDPTSTPADPT